jgi:hypothetical protein
MLLRYDTEDAMPVQLEQERDAGKAAGERGDQHTAASGV